MASPVESMSSSLETNALPDECKDRWKDLVAVHDLHFGYESVLDNGKSETRSDVLSQWGDESGYLQGHPLVLKHPGTLDPLIYANASYTAHIDGVSSAESDSILACVYALIHQPQFQVHIRWRPHTVVLWDNLSTQHCAVGDHFPRRRVMHRVTIAENRRAPYEPLPAGK